jgi:hypothetical protein
VIGALAKGSILPLSPIAGFGRLEKRTTGLEPATFGLGSRAFGLGLAAASHSHAVSSPLARPHLLSNWYPNWYPRRMSSDAG